MAEPVSARVSRDDDTDRTRITVRGGVVRGTVVLSLILVLADLAFALIPAHYLLEDYRVRGDVAYPVMDWFFLLAVLTGGFFAARMGVQALGSREVVEVSGSTLSLRRGALVLSRPERFLFEHIAHLRAYPEAVLRAGPKPADPWQFVEGRNVAFEYGPRTVRFGLRLGEEGARRVVEAIRPRIEAGPLVSSGPDPTRPRAAAPPAPRVTIYRDAAGLHIGIPALRNRVFAATYAAVFLGALVEIVSLAIDSLQPNSLVHINPSALIFLVGAFGAGHHMMWTLYGKEEISIDADGTLRVLRDHGLLKRRFTFDLRQVEGIAVSIQAGPTGVPDLNLARGNVCFAYRGERSAGIYRFGMGLQEGEALTIAALLQKRLKEVRGSVEGDRE